MRFTYDPAKRAAVLAKRGLDLADAAQVFDGFYLSRADVQHSDVEQRTIAVGTMKDETVVIVISTDRKDERRVITMWKADDRERRKYHEQRCRNG